MEKTEIPYSYEYLGKSEDLTTDSIGLIVAVKRGGKIISSGRIAYVLEIGEVLGDQEYDRLHLTVDSLSIINVRNTGTKRVILEHSERPTKCIYCSSVRTVWSLKII